MHRLIKIRIIRDFGHLEDRVCHWMNHIFEFKETGVSFRPPVDFYETARGLVLRMDLAGVSKDALSLTMCGQELVIQGHREPFPPEGVTRYLHHEMHYGFFERRFLVPGAIDPEGLQAQYADGILEVFLPRPAAVSRRIQVKEVPE